MLEVAGSGGLLSGREMVGQRIVSGEERTPEQLMGEGKGEGGGEEGGGGRREKETGGRNGRGGGRREGEGLGEGGGVGEREERRGGEGYISQRALYSFK